MLSPKRKCTPDQSEFYGKALLRVLNQKATARIIKQCLIILLFFWCKLFEVESKWGGQKLISLGTRTQSLTFE